ncbi:Mu transposase C-terminal domain-containing protein [Streptomyces bambusae]|uniref:DDE-type integrase/transposase/recombinase n=1 Tax=Streptomyces bambusae TaxID=1550616 RepID=A0ABS6Z9J4_9ACTN|nr:Mu transposase C-terminal domain-containing protein [Streptomyces bambusae]MBW5484424.1 DDE-type integrase/transposase/recombinase [Streptomyces bambusae]
MQRLLRLRSQGRLSRGHVCLVGECLGVSERTVWRWLAQAEADPGEGAGPGVRSVDRFEVTSEVRVLLAYWRGNASAVHRQLVARARAAAGEPAIAVPGGAPTEAVPLLDPVPSLSTFLRAVRRDLTAGERAGLGRGPEAARAHDVFGRRPAQWRNQTWEADHVQAPLVVDADGELVRPWVTWFIDVATKTITGTAVTPGYPSRASILAALRAAVLRTGPYGPAGGIPEHVRVDRGRDFLSKTVLGAFTDLDTKREDLPAYSPHLKGTVENLNRCVDRMLFAVLPGYTLTPKPRPAKKKPDPDEPVPLTFAEFTAEVLNWARWWNTEHRPAGLAGRTPVEAWQADPTPLTDVPEAALWGLMLEDDGRVRKLSSHGVRWRGRDYLGAWMAGQAGRHVRIRHMPHHDHEIEVCDPAGRHLGTAHLADAATPEQLDELRRARTVRARRLREDAKKAEALRRQRFAPATTATPAQRLGALPAAEADAELATCAGSDMAALALPDLIAPAPPPDDWNTPASLRPSARKEKR